MRRLAALSCAVMALSCAKSDTSATDTAAVAEPAMAPPPAAITLADVAGTWNQKTMAEAGDSVLTTSVLSATSDTTGWTLTVKGRKPVPLRVVTVGGDSIVTVSAPFESVLRKGVQVTTTSVMRLKDGKLVSATTARYSTKGADSVRQLRVVGERAP